MDYKQEIISGFKEFVNKTFKNEEIKNFLLNHERLHLMVDNLTKEFYGAAHIILRGKNTLEDKRQVLKGLIFDFSLTFCKTAIEVREGELKPRSTFADKIMG